MIEGLRPDTGRPVRIDDGQPGVRYVTEDEIGDALGLPEPVDPAELPGWCDECGGGMDGTRRVHAAICSRHQDEPRDDGPGESTEWNPLEG